MKADGGQSGIIFKTERRRTWLGVGLNKLCNCTGHTLPSVPYWRKNLLVILARSAFRHVKIRHVIAVGHVVPALSIYHYLVRR